MLKEHEVVEVEDGIECIEQINDTFDLLFLDIHMPHISGMTIVEELGDSIYTVMIPASGSETLIVKAVLMGARDYMMKPFTKEKLNNVMEAYNVQSKFDSYE